MSHQKERTVYSVSGSSQGENEDDVITCWTEVPTDVTEQILTFVPLPILVHRCRLVCKEWRDIIDQESFWKTKCDRQKDIVVPKIPLKYLDCRMLLTKNPYGRNLVKNWTAEQGLHDWEYAYDFYQVEDPPIGADAIPQDAGCTKCIALSYILFKWSQVIDLLSEGCTQRILDNFTPDIHISVWVAARYDCGIKFEWNVRLVDNQKKILDQHRVVHTEDQWTGRKWTQLQHTFTGYGSGLQYIEFVNAGKDSLGWAGHYGPKIAAPSVRLKFRKCSES